MQLFSVNYSSSISIHKSLICILYFSSAIVLNYILSMNCILKVDLKLDFPFILFFIGIEKAVIGLDKCNGTLVRESFALDMPRQMNLIYTFTGHIKHEIWRTQEFHEIKLPPYRNIVKCLPELEDTNSEPGQG